MAARSPRPKSQMSLYVWTGVVLAVCVAAVILGWHAHGGTPDPTDAANQMSPTTAVINSGVLVFREGLETILVLAAITASFLGANRAYRKPVAVGGGLALLAAVATWFLAIWFIGMFGGSGLAVQAATGIPAIIVLLLVMNWFFHKLYWTGWISHHHKRRRGLLGSVDGDDGTLTRATLLGLGLLGFTSVYREGFEIVIFLQGLRERFGSSVVLEGVVLGLLFTAAVGVLTFSLHQRLPVQETADHHRRAARRRAVGDGRRGGQRDAARRLDRHDPDPRSEHPRLGRHVVLGLSQRRDDRRPVPRAGARARLLRGGSVRAHLAPAPSRRTGRPPRRGPARGIRAPCGAPRDDHCRATLRVLSPRVSSLAACLRLAAPRPAAGLNPSPGD